MSRKQSLDCFACCFSVGTLRFHDNTKEWTLELRRSPKKNTKMNSERDGLNILDLLHQNRNERRQQRRTHLNDGDFNHGILHRRDGIGQMNGSKTILLLFIGWMTLDRWTVPKPSTKKPPPHKSRDSTSLEPLCHCTSVAVLVRCSLEALFRFFRAVLHNASASQSSASSSSMHNEADQIHTWLSHTGKLEDATNARSHSIEIT